MSDTKLTPDMMTHNKMDSIVISGPKWISVKDRLPQEREGFPSDTVLIACSDGEIALGYAHKGKMEYQCEECFRGEEITHWMPLPQPPKDQ